MPIRRHGRGWEVRLQHAGRRFSRTVASRQDALQLEAKLRGRIYDTRAGRVPAYSLEEAVARWLTGEAKALKSHRNLTNKVRALYPQIKDRPLTEIADAAEAVKTAGFAAGLNVATINRRLAILRRVARLAFRQWGWLETDLAGRIQLLPGEAPRFAKATPEQTRALMLACRPRTRLGVLWAALTGLRAGELRSVTPAHFQGRAIVLTATKTGRPRVVPLTPELDPASFPYGLTDREIGTHFREAREAAGMPWLQFRDLRRTFGSWIAQTTQSLQVVQDLLGHTTPTITARHYAHLLEGNLRDAVGTLPRLTGQARSRRGKKKAA